MSKKKTHEEYVREVADINPDIEVLEKYMGINTPILHKCLKHDVKWTPQPASILRGCGCPTCSSEKIHNKLCKTHEQYVDELCRTNSDIEVVGKYVNANTKILHRCKLEGWEWFATPASILSGKGCPKCAGNIKKTHEEYVKEIGIIHPNIIVLENYIDSLTKIAHKCKVDGYVFKRTPSKMLSSPIGCPVCSGYVIGNPPEYKNSIWSSEYKEYFSKYLTEEQMKTYMPHSNKVVKIPCPDCERKKNVRINNLINKGLGCQCSDGKSYPNKFMYNLLDQLAVDYISEREFDWSDKKIYDIYIPSLSCIIENHGIQHYIDIFAKLGGKTLEEEKRNDEYKKQLAINNGITHYVVVDCSSSNTNYIKNSVLNSELPSILNFNRNDICWDKCHEFAVSSLVKVAAKLWGENVSIKETAKQLHMSESTIIKYLRTAAELNWCNWYSGIGYKIASQKLSGANHPLARKVVRLSDGKIYDTVTCAVNSNNISQSTMRRRLKERKGFVYYDEYFD